MHHQAALGAFVALIAALIAALTGCGAGDADPIVLDEPFTRVVLDVASGNLDISASASGAAAVSRTVEKGGGANELWWDNRDGTLYLTAVCHKNNPLNCQVDHVLELPSGVAVDVALGGGFLSLYALDAPIDVAMGAGDVVGSYLRAPSSWITAGSGTVDLEYAEAPESLDAALGDGIMALALPSGTYAASLDVGLGQLDVYGILDDPNAASGLRAAVGEGSLSVFGY
jgi:hypothetical protein